MKLYLYTAKGPQLGLFTSQDYRSDEDVACGAVVNYREQATMKSPTRPAPTLRFRLFLVFIG